ncbi:hypothetical protein AB0M92_23735 [Streptomyces sp. NPDC051582]|uniref:ALF repeat-containing protein n=1 Tax=Streptomyces sp. NPDC051582 TaxID=3155167 RepID=UPI00341D5582
MVGQQGAVRDPGRPGCGPGDRPASGPGRDERVAVARILARPGINDALRAEADKALDGTPEELWYFITVGQYLADRRCWAPGGGTPGPSGGRRTRRRAPPVNGASGGPRRLLVSPTPPRAASPPCPSLPGRRCVTWRPMPPIVRASPAAPL